MKLMTAGLGGIGPFGSPDGYSVKLNRAGYVLMWLVFDSEKADKWDNELAERGLSEGTLSEDDVYNLLSVVERS